tara:strand:- start:299 stop:628 length:330 start_codon:yes stop_codon:yes gene_type:complete
MLYCITEQGVLMNSYDDHDDETTFLSIDLDRYAESEYATVDHPDHYGGRDNDYEVINVIEAWNLNFSAGNVVKYLYRAGRKSSNPMEDLQKAQWYLNRLIEQTEKERLS